jgi:hypothetical protein
MTVYVDEFATFVPAKWRGGGHMIADSHDELMAFAKRLGLQPQWIQRPGTPTEHFDLTRTRRESAIRNGAIPVTGRDLTNRIIDKIDNPVSNRSKVMTQEALL